MRTDNYSAPIIRTASNLYSSGGFDAVRDYLRGLCRRWKLSPAEAVRILFAVVPEDVLNDHYSGEVRR